MNTEWRPCSLKTTLPGVRHGWGGVWDAVKAAVTGKPRAHFAQPVVISVNVRGDADVWLSALTVERTP